MGDVSQASFLKAALKIDRRLALDTLSEEIAYRLRNGVYSFGVSKNLMDRMVEWGEKDWAYASWEEAFQVISQRLPLVGKIHYFAEFDSSLQIHWDLNQSLIALLLFRLEEPRLSRKIAAIEGLRKIIKFHPIVMAIPLMWWLSRAISLSSKLLVLFLLKIAEEPPFIISKSIIPSLKELAKEKTWGPSIMASNLLERLGEKEVVRPVSEIEDLYHLPKPSEEELKRVQVYSCNCGLEEIERFWPEFPVRICKRLMPQLSPQASKEKIQRLGELYLGRDGKAVPPAPILHWQTELFLRVFHEEANGLKEQLWKSGEWEEGLEESLSYSGLPDLAFHLALFNSRCPRPDLIVPDQAIPGEGDLQQICDDSRYPGWLRIGLLENQFLNEKHSFSRPKEEITFSLGVGLCPIGGSFPEGSLPFYGAEYQSWWRKMAVKFPGVPPDDVVPLTGLGHCQDWLGEESILVPSTFFQGVVDILPPEFGEGFVWKDSDEKPILALRYWQVRSAQFNVESPQLCGMDLIARPDIIDRLERAAGCKTKAIRRVSRAPIPPLSSK